MTTTRLRKRVNTALRKVEEQKRLRALHHFTIDTPKYHDDPVVVSCWCGRKLHLCSPTDVLSELADWLNRHDRCPAPETRTVKHDPID